MAQITNITNPTTVTWRLFDEGMGFLERAGLAGLYLTLTAAQEWNSRKDKKAAAVCKNFDWILSDDSVALSWNDDKCLLKLLDWSWQHKDGVYYLPGVHRSRDHRENKFQRIITHNGLVNTFMQIGRTYKPKHKRSNESENELISLDENRQITLRYRSIIDKEQVRQLVETEKSMIPFQNPKNEYRLVKLANWIFPGSVPRFGKAEKGWTGTTKDALILMFAPIACAYAKLHSAKANWLFLIPEIKSLEEFAQNFPELTEDFKNRLERSECAGVGDAALHFSVSYATHSENFGSTVYAVHMGITDYYSSNQSVTDRIRRNVFHLNPRAIRIKEFSLALNFLKNKYSPWTDPETGEERWRLYTSHARHRIADNIAVGRRWYLDLMFPPQTRVDELTNDRKRRNQNISLERLWFELLQYEKAGLKRMTEQSEVWVESEEQKFELLFRKSLHRLLDKEEAAIKRGGARKLRERWEDREQEIRRQLLRVKTQPLAREIIMKLLSEAGGNKELTEHREYVWKLLNDPHNWQKARDLCFLALVTFTDGRLASADDTSKSIQED